MLNLMQFQNEVLKGPASGILPENLSDDWLAWLDYLLLATFDTENENAGAAAAGPIGLVLSVRMHQTKTNSGQIDTVELLGLVGLLQDEVRMELMTRTGMATYVRPTLDDFLTERRVDPALTFLR